MRRHIASGGLLVLTFWACGCLNLENSLVYHPKPDELESPPPPPIQDLELKTADGTKIHARWAPHPMSSGAVLFFHGNGGNVEGWGRAVHEIWQRLQTSVLIVDYPGYGRSGGQPSEKGCYAAADAAYQWLTETKSLAPERVVLWGESLGGAVAVELATRKPHRALVLVRTFTSVPDVAADQLPLLPCEWLMVNRFDSLERIGQCRAPIFIASGDKDRMMQFRHGQRLHAACTAPAELCVLRGIGHNDPLPGGFYAELRTFLDSKAANR